MPSPNNLPPGSNIAAALVTSVSAVIASLWVAISAAAPEFIWQGLQIAFSEPIWTWLPSALLVGMILAFFVEPMMQYLRGYLVDRARYRRVRKRTPNALFAASLAFAFAIVSICLHDALIAFVSAGHGGHSDKSAGLLAAFALVVAWAIGPFAVTIAWLGARCRWLAIPLGIAAVAAPLVAEWLFAWPVGSVISTAVPSLAILGLGYRQNIPENPARGARLVLAVGVVWLATALLIQAAAKVLHFQQFQLYDAADFWVDVRFYIGWALGLLLAPEVDFDPLKRRSSAPESSR
jgi:hypothetical protein